ncbi:2-hydroxyacid dehydrogenase [Bartonella sp. LJL80]
MHSPIAFLSRYAEPEAQKWIATLSKVMPNEKIVSFNGLQPNEREQVEIAVVANPDPAELGALTNLRWIHGVWAGVERMVGELPLDAPPIVRLIDPSMTHAMAEAVLAWCLYLQRDMPTYQRQQLAKEWRPQPYRPATEWTVGILGMGELGQAAAKLLQAPGFKVAGWSRTLKNISGLDSYHGAQGLQQILAASDIVVCLIPLTEETRGLMDQKHFAMMKKGASLINFARGPIVNAEAMLAALKTRHLNHAVLDVFNIEPLPETCPYWHNPHVTVLPHIAALSNPETAAKIVADNIKRWRDTGKLPQTVDRQRGY